MMSKIAACGLVSIFLSTASATADGDDSHTIANQGDEIVLSAGILEKRIHLSGGRIFTASISVDGVHLLKEESNEISLSISRAEPNRNPMDSFTERAGRVSLSEAQADSTDALEIEADKNEYEPEKTVWKNSRTFAGKSWDNCFNNSSVSIFSPTPGIDRLIVRVRSLDDPILAGVNINLIYEIYAGYPVIRKWIEIRNNSGNWIKLGDLVMDDINLDPAFCNTTPLTPSERGADSSIVGFSDNARTRGVIVASEVPSALREIAENGASGYNSDNFEWVLGPAEAFVSEPTFIYAFEGDVIETVSAESLPLDRAVESGFRSFLKQHLGIAPAYQKIPAPGWSSWTNFGPQINEDIVEEQAEIAAQCGFVLFQLDDGWQRGRLGTDPDPDKFSDFYETAQYVQSLGLRLGLWVSSFRDKDASDFDALPGAASNPEITRLEGVAMSFASDWRHYYANDLLFMHDYYGVTYFKQDFSNIKFGDLAAGHDSRTRKESLLRGLRGLLESQAVIRRLAPVAANQISHEIYWGTPGVPCDLAILKVASLYHIPPNDYSGVGHWKKRAGVGEEWAKYEPENLRRQLVKGCFNARKRFYAHRGLPLECIEYYGAAAVNWKGSLTPQVQDRQVASWLMGAPLLFAGDLASLTEENIERYRNRFEIIKNMEDKYGIFRHFQYSGVPGPTEENWHWWGKLNEAGCGAVVVIRGREGPDERTINIPWVQRDENYSVKRLLSEDKAQKYSGAELQDGALKLKLPRLGQEILELSAQ